MGKIINLFVNKQNDRTNRMLVDIQIKQIALSVEMLPKLEIGDCDKTTLRDYMRKIAILIS